jgi:hypothetical protein
MLQQLAAAVILGQAPEAPPQNVELSCGHSWVSDRDGGGKVGQGDHRTGGEVAHLAAADQGRIKLAEADQPIDLQSFAVEAAHLDGFPGPCGQFLLEGGHGGSVRCAGHDGGRDPDDHAGQGRRRDG